MDGVGTRAERRPVACSERITRVGKRRKARLTLYGTRWCGQSAVARRFLDKNDVRYKYVDIDENAKAAEKVMAVARRQPVLVPTPGIS